MRIDDHVTIGFSSDNFSTSRPSNQKEYIASIEVRARLAKIKEFAFADPKSLALYVLNLDQARNYMTFRDRT